jgi:enoyl-CoA hydratase
MSDRPEVAVSRPRPHVGLLTLDRAERRNALSGAMLAELAAACREFEADEDIRAVVLTGGAEIFAAGADLKEMASRDLAEALRDGRGPHWLALRRFAKPLIAAVNGFALGGGCELAMIADIIVAGDNARFGQPEINVGVIPGAGGTQRLPRIVGKSLAMKMVLTGEPLDARAALACGLVAEVVPHELTIERAQALAETIAAKPPIAVRLAKEAVLKAFETTLEAGLDFERRAFHTLFATEDRREGIAAFLEKRRPVFKGR